MIRKVAIPLLLLLLAGAVFALWQANRERPVSQPVAPPVAAVPVEPAVEFHRDIKPIFENRCAVCHGCYDAPCQLKLDSVDGLLRGATKAKVYDSTRLQDAPLTRLFIDAQTPQQWRDKDFFAVIYEGEPPIDALARLDGSLIYRMLDLKRRNPMPLFSNGQTGSNEQAGSNRRTGSIRDHFELGLDRRETCPTPEQFDRYEREHPLWGMPYALPGLSEPEFDVVRRWLETGSPVAERPPLDKAVQNQVAQWERFLNDDDLKSQLMARYLFEHLFIADLYFSDVAQASGTVTQWFRLVRSRTPPGQPVEVIPARRPYDDPGVERVYYRLMPHRGAVLAKTHLPYVLNEARRQRYVDLFLDPDYSVAQLPSYAPEVASNPFVAFRDLPVRSRYRFLLDDAGFIIGNFIKGPVCRGQIALNVIDDRFWVLFADPDIEAMVDGEFLARESGNLHLPAQSAAEKKPALVALTDWRRYAKMQGEYLAAKAAFLHEHFGEPDKLTLSLLWDGNGPAIDPVAAVVASAGEGEATKNRNAALTVFRHFDSASVVRGLVGGTPKTAWVIDYPLLERIYYLLAAGFDVYGDASHQLLTRLYMDFLRMEGEYNFLHLLPQKQREAERNSWYQGVGANIRDSVYRNVPAYRTETGIVYKTRKYKTELFDQVRERLGDALDRQLDLAEAGADEATLAQMQKLATLRGRSVANLPEVVFLRIVRKGAPDEAWTLLHNADYANVAVLLLERERRRPQFDSLTVVPGFIGAYPNAFWRVTDTELPAFVKQFAAVRNARDYRALARRYAIARDDDRFWSHSDWMHRSYRAQDPVGWGLFDFNRYE